MIVGGRATHIRLAWLLPTITPLGGVSSPGEPGDAGQSVALGNGDTVCIGAWTAIAIVVAP